MKPLTLSEIKALADRSGFRVINTLQAGLYHLVEDETKRRVKNKAGSEFLQGPAEIYEALENA